MAARVILVEPDPEQREQFANAIKGSAFEVCQYTDTNKAAVELYDQLRPHLLVLRVVSSEMGAGNALDTLKKKNRDVKVAVSYDVRSTHLLMSAYSHGAISAIKQPFRLHRVVEKLTYAVASERHEKLAGAIIRLEHPVEVRYKGTSLFSWARVGFCERLGLSDMDLNTERSLKPRSGLKVDLLLPPPAGTMKVMGVVEDVESTRPDNWCGYISLRNMTTEMQSAIEAFLVKAARKL